jgi:hypothetical protein
LAEEAGNSGRQSATASRCCGPVAVAGKPDRGGAGTDRGRLPPSLHCPAADGHPALRVGRVVLDGIITPGTLHVIEPGAPAECLFRGAYDALHLHIANELISECMNTIPDRHDGLLAKAPPPRDTVIERLGMNLLASESLAGCSDQSTPTVWGSRSSAVCWRFSRAPPVSAGVPWRSW